MSHTVCVVGCGHIAARHLANLRRLRGVRVAAVCDLRREAAERAAREFRVPRAYDDPREMLARERPFAVHVLTPPGTHRPVVVESLEAGAHVLVEKPMALRAEDADAMIEAARRTGRRLSVCHNFLFEPAILNARRIVESGAIGRVSSVDVFWRVASGGAGDRYAATAWIRELPGGAFEEVAAHPLYLIGSFLPGPRIAFAIRGPRDPDAPGRGEELRAILESPAGLGSLTISLSAEPLQVLVRIHGTRGTLRADLTTNVLVRLAARPRGRAGKVLQAAGHAGQILAGTARNSLLAGAGLLPFGHRVLIERFHRAIGAGAEPPVPAEDGRDTVALLESLWAAIAGGGAGALGAGGSPAPPEAPGRPSRDGAAPVSTPAPS